MLKPRLKRLLSEDGKCLNVAIDHGLFNEPSLLGGIENAERAIERVVDGSPDAMQLSVGLAPLLQRIPGRYKPALVLRADVTNLYAKGSPPYLFSKMLEGAVETALRLDAACLCLSLFLLPDMPEVYAQCLENILRLKPEAERYGMPLMLEPLVLKKSTAGDYTADGDPSKIRALLRQAVELGADIIKADPSDNLRDYHKVIEVTGGIPVLVRDLGRASEGEILSRTHTLMREGAKGIVYGRNILQHSHPSAMTKALMAIVHRGATPDLAASVLELESRA